MNSLENGPKIELLLHQTIFDKEFEKYLVIPPDKEREFDKELVQYALFELGPIDRGQGLTLANSLRRVLLNDIKGFSITSVKFEPKWRDLGTDEANENKDLVHEYSTIPGVWESIFEILINLRKIKIRRDDFPFQPFEKQVVHICVDQPRQITAGDFELPFPLKILNPKQPIAQILSENLTLDLTLTIELNSGMPLWKGTKQTYPINEEVVIDEFSLPIKWANFVLKSDPLLVSNSTETILFEMFTDGTITPPEAMEQAAKLCMNLFSFISTQEKDDESLEQIEPITLDVLEYEPKQFITDDFPIEDLGLSVRAFNCLKRANLENVTDLLSYSKADLLEMKNFGKKSADEVIEALQNKLGITLPR
jgi:DNA-directed RNA polymerase subunit alpha